jgi:Co/Zn/Cd efflux system component
MAGCDDNCGVGAGVGSVHERRILITVLIINATMFAAEFSAGLVAGSTALLADSLDMLADSIIYAIGLRLSMPSACLHWGAPCTGECGRL